MMEDPLIRDLLVQGIASAKAHEDDLARRYLERLLGLHPSTEDSIEAWYWLSQICANLDEKRNYIELILANNPADMRARRALEVLDGKLKPAEIIDPDHWVAPVPSGSAETAVDRFTCPKCGGRMVFTPDGQSLVCENCEAQQRLSGKGEGPASGGTEQDFLAALATGKGHQIPVQVASFQCHGCGSQFILPPHALSGTCPYCGSVYVVEQAQTSLLIAPDGVIPMKVDKDWVSQHLSGWIHDHGADHSVVIPQAYGMYLPVWAFNLSGTIPWHGLKYENRNWVPVSGEELAQHENIVVSASQRSWSHLKPLLESFRLEEAVAYDPAYLADWLAETYQVTVADAALSAREMVVNREREQIQRGILSPIHGLFLNTAQLTVDSYKMLLLPVWIGQFGQAERLQPVLVNGQNGQVFGDLPGIVSWFKKWL